MKFFSRIFTPTRNRRLNELMGFLLFVSALLLFLALITYSPLDSSFNTAGLRLPSRPAQNWIGPVGAYGSDLVFQLFGVSAFLIPVCLGISGAALVPLSRRNFAAREDLRIDFARPVFVRTAGSVAVALPLGACDSG